uniref:Uncharacterized protein n=1 Tax=Tetraselmis chuii TaxID=63592 RepID=A0A7S1SV86_9CHLO|mmetsp:Transcript_30063/g.53761  ORF Transcript_30063/g.53761 Transcript_30063/m.53761 type:complete len:127 (+) Transcript_30063:251-631(+)
MRQGRLKLRAQLLGIAWLFRSALTQDALPPNLRFANGRRVVLPRNSTAAAFDTSVNFLVPIPEEHLSAAEKTRLSRFQPELRPDDVSNSRQNALDVRIIYFASAVFLHALAVLLIKQVHIEEARFF